MTYQMRVAEDGRLIAPDELARELDLKPGDSLTIDREDGKLVLKTYLQVVREVQARVRALLPADYTGSLVDELIAERRAEARRENAELEEWVRSGKP